MSNTTTDDRRTSGTDAGGEKTRMFADSIRAAVRAAAGGLAGLAVAATTLAQAPPDTIALTGGKIITVSGETIEHGTIVIDRGRIVAVGTDVDIPYDAMEYDMSGKVLMPGMIDPHTARGLDIANENLPVTPFLDVYDSIDPSSLSFEDALRSGHTTVHVMPANNTVVGGVSRALRPIGLTVDEMTVRPDVGLKVTATPKAGYDRMRQLATLREAFWNVDHSLEQLAEQKYEEKLKEDGEEIDVPPAEARKRGKELITPADYDDSIRNLIRLREGELVAWMYCGSATDVKPAIDVAEKQGFLDKAIFVLGGDAHRAVREIVRTGRPVVLDDQLVYRDRDPVTGEIEEVFVPRVMYDAGVKFALQPNPSGSMAEQYLNYQAARLVRNGIPRDVALKSVTMQPASFLGLGDRLGSIEEGKTANIVVLSGDPFDFSTWVEQVFVDGVLAYERSEDPRLKELFELEVRVQNAANADAGASEEDEAEGDEGGDDTGAETGDSGEEAGGSDAGRAGNADGDNDNGGQVSTMNGGSSR